MRTTARPISTSHPCAWGWLAAVLIELVLCDRVMIRDGRIVLRDHRPIHEPVADSTLANVVGARGERLLPVWIRGLATDISDRTTGALLAAGIVVRETRRRMGMRRDRFVLTDPAIAGGIRGAVRYAIYGREYSDAQCAALCGLVGVLGLDGPLYLSETSGQLRAGLAEIASWHHSGVQDVIAAVDRLIGETAVSVYR